MKPEYLSVSSISGALSASDWCDQLPINALVSVDEDVRELYRYNSWIYDPYRAHRELERRGCPAELVSSVLEYCEERAEAYLSAMREGRL